MYKWFEMYKSDFTFKVLNNCSCTGNLMDYPNGFYSKFKFSKHYFWKKIIKWRYENWTFCLGLDWEEQSGSPGAAVRPGQTTERRSTAAERHRHVQQEKHFGELGPPQAAGGVGLEHLDAPEGQDPVGQSVGGCQESVWGREQGAPIVVGKISDLGARVRWHQCRLWRRAGCQRSSGQTVPKGWGWGQPLEAQSKFWKSDVNVN